MEVPYTYIYIKNKKTLIVYHGKSIEKMNDWGGGTPMTRKPPYHLSSFIIHTGSTGEG